MCVKGLSVTAPRCLVGSRPGKSHRDVPRLLEVRYAALRDSWQNGQANCWIRQSRPRASMRVRLLSGRELCGFSECRGDAIWLLDSIFRDLADTAGRENLQCIKKHSLSATLVLCP